MKAVTIYQPWASLIAAGLKTIETRTWATSYRGPLAIHAGKTVDLDGFRCLNRGLIDRVIGFARGQGWELPFPTGAILAVAELVDCRVCVPGDRELALCECECVGWILEDVRALAAPVPCRGYQRIWTVDDAIGQRLR